MFYRISVYFVFFQKHDHECFELGDHFYEQIEEMGFEKLEEHALHLNVNDTVH